MRSLEARTVALLQDCPDGCQHTISRKPMWLTVRLDSRLHAEEESMRTRVRTDESSARRASSNAAAD
eukprot:3397785-Prymnesium_polylepis.2